MSALQGTSPKLQTVIIHMFNGLRTRILLVMGSMILLTSVGPAFLAQREMEATVFNSEDRHAQDLLYTALLNVENEYESLLFHKKSTLERRKQGLKDLVELGMAPITEAYDKFKRGDLPEDEAKRQAIRTIRRFRYDNGVGYLWINDIGTPLPHLIMHPTLPELEGKELDDPKYFTALGLQEHVLGAMAEIVQAKGSGFVDYLWPKPVAGELSADQPKIAYVKLFEEWGWVVGTGVYADDIDKETDERKQAIIAELNKTFAKVRVAESGYLYIFNGAKEMLVHPNFAGQNLAALKNPVTGKFILNELIEAAENPLEPMMYLWDKPEHPGDFHFKKMAYVVHFKPLDWYIVSSVYTEEFIQPALELRSRIFWLSLLSLMAGLIASIILARNLAMPLQKLTQAALKVKTTEIDIDSETHIPISGTTETRQLGIVLGNMVQSMRKIFREKDQALFAVADSYQELTYSNTRLESEIAERIQAEKALQQAHNELETRVEERTAELATSNSRLQSEIEVRKQAQFDTERANQAKSEFLANISHEIRTPLNAVTGFSALLSSVVSDPVQQNYLAAIQASGKTLLVLINDILDLSKIEAGMMSIHPGPVDLRHLFGEIMQIFSTSTNNKQVLFCIDISEDLPPVLMLDEVRLRQVLLNLVGNAVKFTEVGQIKLSAAQLKWNQQQDRLDFSICVADTGIGIQEEDRARIFDSFQQIEGHSRNEHGGTGLGLAISKRLVEMMNGEISVTGSAEPGSTFQIILKDIALASPEETENVRKPETGGTSHKRPFSSEAADPKKSYNFKQSSAIQKPEELLSSLQEDVLPEFESLKGAIIIKKVEQFEDLLIALGNKHDIQILVKYAAELSTHRKSIDVAGMNRTLKEFPILVEQLISALEGQHA